jgi:predicted dehydrogenase
LKPVGVGIIGCGNISSAYLSAAKLFPILDVRAVADLDSSRAKARSAEFGVSAVGVQELIFHPDIEIIINLTVPKAHVEVGLQAIAAGKHVHSEKPLGISTEEASRLRAMAASKGLRIGCAPDTFLGGAQQTCRKLVDGGAIGQVIAGTAFFMCPGHEEWHPDPGFFYLTGGGPILDMGPYYITSLINLLGPIRRATSITSRARNERIVKSEPLKGSKIRVEVATHAAGTLEFVGGAVITIVMSFDVAHHSHRPIELYGTTGSLSVPDPDTFGGQIEIAADRSGWLPIATEHSYADGNYRILGVADMAYAIRSNRPHRANGDIAFHVLEVMEALQLSSDRGIHIEIASRPERPASMSLNAFMD